MGGWWVGGWVGQKKTKLMLYSTLVEIEVEVGVELGNIVKYDIVRWQSISTTGTCGHRYPSSSLV